MSSRSNPATAIDLIGKIALIDGYWQPRVVAEMNDYQFKVVKLEGDFEWHQHDATDETFLVLEGELHIDVRDGAPEDRVIVLHAGQMTVVPKGMQHRPRANGEVKLLLIEPRGVLNTGDGAPTERTVENDQWI
jgi:mannose-6-phosphate isomerase-like protein (cupin superfamily)